MLMNWIGGIVAVVATVLVQFLAQVLLARVVGRAGLGQGPTVLQRLAAWHVTLLASLAGVSADTLELSRGHRVLGAVQSTVGILMFGWSTALLVALIGRPGPGPAG